MERDDALSAALRSVRLTGSVQFCFMPSGSWRVEAPQSMGMDARMLRYVPFHIVVQGQCWLELDGVRSELASGDIIAFPRGTAHRLGASDGSRLVSPLADLPKIAASAPFPILKYGDDAEQVRMMCGYLECEALDFKPIRDVLPEMLMVRTTGDPGAAWLGASIAQIVAEVDRPSAGGRTVLERLTEMMFLELLRREISQREVSARGWMAAVADQKVGKCLGRIHEAPMKDWTIDELAQTAGTSRSVLIERFQEYLDTSPMEYIRGWRLHLASLKMLDSSRTLAEIAYEAGYGSETAFNRAFKRAYGEPPAAWRRARS